MRCRYCRGPALHAAHGHEIKASLSRFHLGHELERVRARLEVSVEPEIWAVFATLSLVVMAAWLRKAVRGPKKPLLERQNDLAKPTVSMA